MQTSILQYTFHMRAAILKYDLNIFGEKRACFFFVRAKGFDMHFGLCITKPSIPGSSLFLSHELQVALSLT